MFVDCSFSITLQIGSEQRSVASEERKAKIRERYKGIDPSKYLGLVQIDRSIMKTLDEDDISTILTYCAEALEKYWK